MTDRNDHGKDHCGVALKKIKLSGNKISARPIVRVSYALTSMIFLIGSGTLLAFSLIKPTSVETIRVSIMDIASPVLEVVNAPVRHAADFVKNASGLASLQQQNFALKEENARLMEWYLRARTLETENAELKTLLNVKTPNFKEFATAEILADTGSTFAKSLMIKAGKKDGIAKGTAAISSSGVVGRITEVGEKTARVLLLSDMNSRVPVIIDVDGQPLNAMLAGRNDEYPTLLHLPEGQEISDGAHIITSGFGGIYPRGLAVGQARHDASGNLHVVPYMNLNDLTYLQIIMIDTDDNAAWE